MSSHWDYLISDLGLAEHLHLYLTRGLSRKGNITKDHNMSSFLLKNLGTAELLWETSIIWRHLKGRARVEIHEVWCRLGETGATLATFILRTDHKINHQSPGVLSATSWEQWARWGTCNYLLVWTVSPWQGSSDHCKGLASPQAHHSQNQTPNMTIVKVTFDLLTKLLICWSNF